MPTRYVYNRACIEPVTGWLIALVRGSHERACSSNRILWISTAKICMMLTTEVNGVHTTVLASSE